MVQTVKLGTICKMQSGGTPRRSTSLYYKNGTIPWAKIGDIENARDGWIYDTEEKITELGLKSINNRLFPQGTLLFAMYGSVGKTSLVGTEMSSNQAILGIQPNKDILDVKYLNYWMKSRIKDFENQSRGVALKNLSATIMKEQSIPLPPLETQKKIAAILDKADELRQNDKKILEKYDQLAQSVFLEMFGDTYLNPKKWEVRKIKEIAAPQKNAIKAGPFGSSLKKEYYVPAGYKIYGQEQVIRDDLSYGDYYISEEHYKKLDSCKISAGDILISLVGSYGLISIVPQDFRPGIINPRLMKISVNNKIIEPLYLKFLLQTKGIKTKIKNATHGGTMDIVNVAIMKEIEIPVPPLEFQKQFLNINNIIERQRSLSLKSHQKSENLFQSLLQRAFRGELG